MVENACDPTIERHFKGHRNAVTGLHFHPDATQLVSSSLDRTLIIWNLTQSIRAYRFVAHKDAILDVSYAPSGEMVASASRDRSVRLWIPKVSGESLDFQAHSGTITSVEFGPDGEKLLTASHDKSVKLWMVCRKKFLTLLSGHTNWVHRAKFSTDGKLVVSCSEDNSIKLWDMNNGRCIKTFKEIKGTPMYAEFHPSGLTICSTYTNGCVRVYDLRKCSLYQHYAIHNGSVNMARFHPTGNFLLTASDDSTMKVLDLLEGRPIYTLKGHMHGVKAIVFSSNGEQFASGGADRQLFMWKTNFGKDDKARKVPRIFVSPRSELRCNNLLRTKSEDVENNDGESEKEEEELLTDTDVTPTESIEMLCEGPIANIPCDKPPVEVINTRNARRLSRPYISNRYLHVMPNPQSTDDPIDAIQALTEQIKSLRSMLGLLEERLTVVEGHIKK